MITDSKLLETLCYIPSFLRREPEPVAPIRTGPKPHRGASITMPALSKTFYREREADAQVKASRREAALALKQRRIAAAATKRQDQSAVLISIRDGSQTWGRIVASLGLETPRLRSALRALVKNGKVVKLSSRRYGLE